MRTKEFWIEGYLPITMARSQIQRALLGLQQQDRVDKLRVYIWRATIPEDSVDKIEGTITKLRDRGTELETFSVILDPSAPASPSIQRLFRRLSMMFREINLKGSFGAREENFRALASALMRNPRLQKLIIEETTITDQAAVILCSALQNSGLRGIRLTNVEGEDSAIASIFRGIEGLPSLTRLHWGMPLIRNAPESFHEFDAWSDWDSPDALDEWNDGPIRTSLLKNAFAAMLRDPDCQISKLILDSGETGDLWDLLQHSKDAIFPSVMHLWIRGNHFRGKQYEGSILPLIFSKFPNLRVLDVQDSSVSNFDFLDTLKSPCYLKRFSFEGCPVYDNAKEIIKLLWKVPDIRIKLSGANRSRFEFHMLLCRSNWNRHQRFRHFDHAKEWSLLFEKASLYFEGDQELRDDTMRNLFLDYLFVLQSGSLRGLPANLLLDSKSCLQISNQWKLDRSLQPYRPNKRQRNK